MKRRISTTVSNRSLGSALLVLLIPGLSLKRWLALGAAGLGAIALGVLFALKISLWPGFTSFAELVSLRGEAAATRGVVFITVGLICASGAAFMLSRSLASARSRRRHWSLLDSLYVERILGGGPKVVVIGGGSGLPNLLRGLKHYTSNLTAVVTVADDGGSSGRLRSELGIPAPGDIRNCLVALADSEVVMQQLMDYRFSTNGQLDGHSFGNMLIAALAGIGGDFSKGVELAGELLAIRGRVIPSTATDIVIVGSTISGQMLLGESRVGTATERLRSIALMPPDAPAHPEARDAIMEADLIILGPGSLFTSIVPNLLVREIATALASASGLKMYICNVAEEPGQTTGYSVLDHLNVVRHYAGNNSVNIVIANNNALQGRDSPSPSLIPSRANWDDTTVCIQADVIDEEIPTRHDPAKLAATIAATYQKHRGSRRRLPPLRRNLQGPSEQSQSPMAVHP